MKKITIFSDVHANLPALQAVLQDFEQRGLTDLYCLGDLVGYGTFPNQVIQIIRERQIPTITLEVDSRARMPEILRVHSPVIRRTVEWWDREMEGEGR